MHNRLCVEQIYHEMPIFAVNFYYFSLTLFFPYFLKIPFPPCRRPPRKACVWRIKFYAPCRASSRKPGFARTMAPDVPNEVADSDESCFQFNYWLVCKRPCRNSLAWGLSWFHCIILRLTCHPSNHAGFQFFISGEIRLHCISCCKGDTRTKTFVCWCQSGFVPVRTSHLLAGLKGNLIYKDCFSLWLATSTFCFQTELEKQFRYINFLWEKIFFK